MPFGTIEQPRRNHCKRHGYELALHMPETQGEHLRRHFNRLLMSGVFGQVIMAILHYAVPCIAEQKGEGPQGKKVYDTSPAACASPKPSTKPLYVTRFNSTK